MSSKLIVKDLKSCRRPPRIALTDIGRKNGRKLPSTYDWFAADRYSIADIALYAYTHSADEDGFDLSAYESVRGSLNRARMQPNHIAQMREDTAMTPEAFQ